jgi:hypothetical protein
VTAVALGIRPHSGWAVVVAVTAPPDVQLVHRSRIEVLAEGDPRQPWHAAQDAGLSPADAAALADRVAEGARAAAVAALAAVVADVAARGLEPVAAALVGEPHPVPDPARILASHALLHTAEGELFWSALAEGAGAAGLGVLAVPPKSVSLDPYAELLATMGKAAGPPWRADHKLAVVAALLALDADADAVSPRPAGPRR